ncbi:unnamed protein product, partial [Peniophora sp. CBMAI 1063]
QFASDTTRTLLTKLGVTSSLSTSYHSQTDGQTERFNQELEQYLRAFCNHRQDDWVDWLPIAQFIHNSQVHSAPGKSPFELLYGFAPRAYPPLVTFSRFPKLTERLPVIDAQEINMIDSYSKKCCVLLAREKYDCSKK